MKNISLFAGMICLLGACHPAQMKIEGEVAGVPAGKIYLGEITNEYYGTYKAIDSAVVENGKFTFVVDTVKPGLLFLGMGQRKGGVFFAEPGQLKIKSGKVEEEAIEWEVAGSGLDALYRTFVQQNDSVKNQKRLDSLDQLFYAAREKDDREEMARIKEESILYYEEARYAESKLVKETIAANKENAFGLYLYYKKIFGYKEFPDFQDIEAERQYLAGFGPKALASCYKDKMERQLDLYAGCAIGAVAPEISGVDTLGNPIKLSDFRGKYVIVDFWDSYCHWCREETPWLKKALEAFKDKNFTILGVSDDRKRELWLKAIEEDGSHWDHLLLQPGDQVMDTYCIKGIPHIILVGPDGKILAKEMRHEKLTEVPAKFMK